MTTLERQINDMEKQKFVLINDTTTAVRFALGDTASSDAFSRFRVSSPNVIFNSMEPLAAKSDIWSEATSGAATIAYVANTSAHKLETTAASGDKATRSSKKLAEYVPGTSLLVFLTGVMGAGATNSRQRMGLFDDQNGLFFEQRDGVIGVTLRTYTSGTAVDTHISQASWNIDKFDGTGPSGYTIDPTKANIFIIDLQWLGVGRVRFGFDVDGIAYYCHEILNANAKTTVYMTTPRLPVRYEVVNVDASTALDDFRQICSAVITEGDVSSDPFPRSVNNGITGIGTSTTIKPVLSIRLKSAYVNKANIRPKNISITTTSKSDHLYQIWLNPTLTGASFADVDGIAQKDVAASGVASGTLLASFYGSAKTQAVTEVFNEQRVLGAALDGTSDIITVTATTLSGTDTAYAAIDYEELY